jgi:hypothetical protein
MVTPIVCCIHLDLESEAIGMAHVIDEGDIFALGGLQSQIDLEEIEVIIRSIAVLVLQAIDVVEIFDLEESPLR